MTILPRTATMVLALALPAAGCGGSDPTGNSSPPPPPPVPSYSTSGMVYARSDTVAYAPEATSGTTIAGASVGFGNATAASGTAGSYSVSTTGAIIGDNLPVGASAAGYLAGSTPFLTYEPTRPVNIALYPEAAVTPRPGFVKGFEFMDSGGGLPTIYGNGLHPKVMERVRDQVGANLVMTDEGFSLTSFRIATNTVTMAPDPWGMYSVEMYRSLVTAAKARGLKFMMATEVYAYAKGAPTYLEDASVADWKSRFQIPKTNTAFWDAWFAAWTPLILARAAIARDLGVEYFSLGWNLDYVTRLEPARWQQVIDAIRALGYAGQIVYFANAHVDTGFPEWNSMDPATPRLFDVFGIKMGGVVGKSSPGEVLSPAQTRARMRAGVTTTLDKVKGFGRPVFVFLTTPSVHGAVISDEYIEPCIAPSCASVAPQRTRDFQQQADVYQAIAEVVNARPTGDGQVMGLLSAQYWYYDTYAVNQSAYDKSSNVRGKPAEMVLKWWFQRW